MMNSIIIAVVAALIIVLLLVVLLLFAKAKLTTSGAVSYTHLTLPTILRV